MCDTPFLGQTPGRLRFSIPSSVPIALVAQACSAPPTNIRKALRRPSVREYISQIIRFRCGWRPRLPFSLLPWSVGSSFSGRMANRFCSYLIALCSNDRHPLKATTIKGTLFQTGSWFLDMNPRSVICGADFQTCRLPKAGDSGWLLPM